MIRLLLIFSMLYSGTQLLAQDQIKYQSPPPEIERLVNIDRAPSIRVNTKGDQLVLLYSPTFPSLADLSKKELRLAGLRIDPAVNIASRITYYNKIETKTATDKNSKAVSGLPNNPRFAYFTWSPDESKMAFTHSSASGLELWILDIKLNSVKRLGDFNLNANLGSPFLWMSDGTALMIRTVPASKRALIEPENTIPEGPIISDNVGSKAQNRTYQDLLRSKIDEDNFEQLALSELHQIDLKGTITKWADKAMYSSLSLSPDGNLLIVETMLRPFSYLVPYYRFPEKTDLYNLAGEHLLTINETGLLEELPSGFMAVRTGKRGIRWRQDEGATLVWAEALDDGDPEVEVEYRDAVFQWRAPFDSTPERFARTINRFAGIDWADQTHALLYDYWWNTRNTKTYLINPSNQSAKPKVLSDRNYQDIYSNPGSPVHVKNEYNRSIVYLKNNKMILLGEGHTTQGQFPFIDSYDLESTKAERVYQSAYTDKIEHIQRAIDIDEMCFLVRLESPTEYPNYYLRKLGKSNSRLEQISFNVNPFESIKTVEKSLIKYQRDDGIELSGTLYLPLGYDKSKKKKVPLLIWAYPSEYKDKSSAGQTNSNPNSFTYPHYGSFIYWVTRGYAVLDDASFPIIGEGEIEPNDNFRKQLVSNAKAAIDAVDSLGYIDRTRVGVGGHSYGAFMVANLLSHCDLFAAGIARSGAYNRTLTPFGFQSEERNYWEAPDIYNTMSPFMHADKMKYPLLLVHGEADNNSGTYPLQSERYFNALKGLGATARLVILPKESHGYQAKESIMHLLWEQDEWLEKYVKKDE